MGGFSYMYPQKHIAIFIKIKIASNIFVLIVYLKLFHFWNFELEEQ